MKFPPSAIFCLNRSASTVAATKRPSFGRPGTNLKIGIVGLPNVGKSYLFNSLTNSQTPSENYPFCTILPTEARARVDTDPRQAALVEVYRPDKVTSPFLGVIDIAGLVRGASSGAGLGNAFLANVKGTDGIFHLVRAFEDTGVEHVEGGVDPMRDLEIIHDELRIKDMEFLTKQILARAKDAKIPETTKNPRERVKLDTLKTLQQALDLLEHQNVDLKDGTLWTSEQVGILNDFYFLTTKPVVILVNLGFDEYIRGSAQTESMIAQIRQRYPHHQVIPFSGTFEEELVLLGQDDDEEATSKYLKELSVSHGRPVKSAIGDIVRAGFGALDLIYYFTCGKSEVRAWTIRAGTLAPQAASQIHSDFESAFINCKVMDVADIVANGADAAKVRVVGRDYVVEDGDVLDFNVASQSR